MIANRFGGQSAVPPVHTRTVELFLLVIFLYHIRTDLIQLLREVPEKDVLFPEPQYSPYIQSLIDRLKEEESLDLAAIDWSAFEMADVTIPFFQDNADGTSRSWIMGLVGRTRTAPIFQSRRRVFF